MMRTTLFVSLLAGASALVGMRVEGLSGGTAGGGSGSHVGGGTLYNGEKVWRSAPDTRFVEVPAWMAGMDLVKPHHRADPKTELYWDCPRSAKKGCTMYLFQYNCPGCKYAEGGLQKNVMMSGNWEKFFCAPKFEVLGQSGSHHPMIAYRSHTDAGESVSVVLTDLTEFVIMGGDDRVEMQECGEKTLESTCEATHLKGQCEWDDSSNTCINRRCVSKWKGPGGYGGGSGVCTKHCVDKDLKL